MSYMRLNNINVREKGKKRNLFDKVNELKQKMNVIVPEIEGQRLIDLLHHIKAERENKYYYGRKGWINSKIKKNLTPIEHLIKELLIKEKLNPSTVYRWLLATRIPSDIMDKLRKGMISQKKAYEIALNRRKNLRSAQSLLLMESVRDIIRRY
ncbi:MAG: hypothetical protein AAB298_08345 [Pseudomonadota bacterium]